MKRKVNKRDIITDIDQFRRKMRGNKHKIFYIPRGIVLWLEPEDRWQMIVRDIRLEELE